MVVDSEVAGYEVFGLEYISSEVDIVNSEAVSSDVAVVGLEYHQITGS